LPEELIHNQSNHSFDDLLFEIGFLN
jgi:hypothetical protein